MDENNEKTLKRILLKDREIILLGTAHVSKESIKDVESTIREENPDCHAGHRAHHGCSCRRAH